MRSQLNVIKATKPTKQKTIRKKERGREEEEEEEE
jgi:hypothetical protein